MSEPDVDPRHSGGWRDGGSVVVAVAVGGMVGAAARYGLLLWWPVGSGEFPTTTVVINVLGCAVMGVFMVATDHLTGHRLVRPFFGTGVLGGFTTFSTFSGEVEELVTRGDARVAILYLVVTLVAALGAAGVGAVVGRRLFAGVARA